MSDPVHELVSLYALGSLDNLEREAFEAHLRDGCEACETELSAFSQIANAIGASVPADPPAHLRERLLFRLPNSPQKPGVLFERSGVLIACSGEIPWRPFGPGIDYKLLFEDAAMRRNTSLIRMDAGAHYPSHRHAGTEELYLLSGDLQVEGQTMHPGDYCRAEFGTKHSETFTEFGCVFLLSASPDNEVLA